MTAASFGSIVSKTSLNGSITATGALLDRLTHHVHIVTIEGDSHRLRTSAKRGKKGDEPELTT